MSYFTKVLYLTLHINDISFILFPPKVPTSFLFSSLLHSDSLPARMTSLGIRNFSSASKVSPSPMPCRINNSEGRPVLIERCQFSKAIRHNRFFSTSKSHGRLTLTRLLSFSTYNCSLSSNHSQPTASSQRGITFYRQQIPNSSMYFASLTRNCISHTSLPRIMNMMPLLWALAAPVCEQPLAWRRQVSIPHAYPNCFLHEVIL